MTQSPATVSASGEQTSFELEHFELTAENRVELSGRWFGVRGRRFVRPTLTLFGHGKKSRRALADLEHKPWSAEEGESWTAAFPCQLDVDEVLEVELAVAPDIAVTLAPPESLLPRAGPGTPRARRVAAMAPPAPEHARARTLRDEALRPAELAQTELSSVRARRDAAVSKLEALIVERDQAVDERDRAVDERDRAVDERDRAVDERHRAVDERDRAVDDRDRAVDDRDRAVDERDRAVDDRDRALRERNHLRAERGQALSARDAALARLDRVQSAASDRLAGLRAELERERAEAETLVQSRPTPIVPVRTAPITATPAPSRDRVGPPWLMRALAVIVLLATLAALAIILNSA